MNDNNERQTFIVASNVTAEQAAEILCIDVDEFEWSMEEHGEAVTDEFVAVASPDGTDEDGDETYTIYRKYN